MPVHHVMQKRFDLLPTDAVIFADHLDKALEYGHWPKLVLALRLKSLKRSFKVVPATASHSDLEMIRRDYPAVVRLDDGSLWCSRLREGDNRFASGYEKAYGWYVPGEPREALAAIFLCCRREDLSVARDYFRKLRGNDADKVPKRPTIASIDARGTC